MLQRKCHSDTGCWKKSWHSCTVAAVTPSSPDQQRPRKVKKHQGTCRNRFCWVRITQQHRVLTRNNCLRRPSKVHQDLTLYRRLYKTRRRCLHHLHFENDQQLAKQPMILQNAWTPPITAETLKELSLDQITSNIQLRHDLLFDRNLRFRPNFDGASGKAKQRKAERYWARLDRAFRSQENYEEFLPVLLDQVVQSLALLQHNDNWPKHITMDAVRSILNPDLILRGLATNTLDLKSRVQLIVSVLHHMCPVEHRPRIQLFVLYFSQQCFAKGFRQCFATLEAIQLDRANRFLREQRTYLVQTCAQYEQQRFQKRTDDTEQHPIEAWLAASLDNPDWSFLKVYHTALVRLVTADHDPFPQTLMYDQHRLVHQFRAEFIYIITLAILFIPYYYLVGKRWNKTDLQTLKLKLAQLLKKGAHQYHQFAMYACEAASTTHARYGQRFTLDTARWADWLKQHMNASSEIYQLMHGRVFHILRRVSQGQQQYHDFNGNTLKALDREMLALGLRIRAVGDLNLATYGVLYHQIWHMMSNSFKF